VTLAPASHGAVIVPGLIPMATLVLGHWLLGQRIGRRQILGLAVSIAGLAVVVGPELGGGAGTLIGDAFFVISAGLWAGYTLLGRTGRSHLDPAVLTAFVTATGALAFLPLALLQPGGPGDVAGVSTRALGSIAYLGSIGTALSFVTFLAGVRLIGAARASAYTVLVPLFGVSLTVSLLSEPFGPLSFVGAAVVIAGLWLTQTARPASGPAVATEPA
jgi:drug/metabolite transporter (DMT)-like permease